MQNIKNALLYLLLTLLPITNIAQNNIAAIQHHGDFIVKNDTAIISLTQYTGEIQWQKSEDGENWMDIDGATTESLSVVIVENTFFRAIVTEGSCDPYYSDVIKIHAVELYESVVVIDSTVELLNDTNSINLGYYVFAWDYDNIPETDDIIVGSHGEGFIRKVIQSVPSDNGLVIETSYANLEDVFVDLDFLDSISITLGGSQKAYINGKAVPVKVNYEKQGVSINKSGSGIDISDTELFSNQIITATITEGNVNFDPTISRKLSYSLFSGLSSLKIIADGNLEFNCDLELNASFPMAPFQTEVPIASYTVGPIFMGPIPLFIILNFNAGLEASTTLAGIVRTGIESDLTVRAGANYDSGEWTSIYYRSGSFNQSSVQFGGDATVNAMVYINPSISVRIAGVAGPGIDTNPYLSFNASGSTLNDDWQWYLYGGLNSSLDFKASIFGYSVADYSYELPTWQTTIASDSLRAAYSIELIHGADQGLSAGGTLNDSIVVRVTDVNGNPVEGAEVNFSPIDGLITSLSEITNEDGLAWANWMVSNNGENEMEIEAFFSNGNHIMNSPLKVNSYVCPHVLIGKQCWMGENLDIDFGDNTYYEIYDSYVDEDTDETIYILSATITNYGRLYSQEAAMTICPPGWRLPSNEDWIELISTAGGDNIAGGRLKSTNVWQAPNTGATDLYGFTAFPAGRAFQPGTFEYPGGYGLDTNTGFWSSDQGSAELNYVVELDHNSAGITLGTGTGYESIMLSVRCIMEY